MIIECDILRITIRIDDNIMKELVALTAVKNKTEAIHIAIRDYLKRRAKLNLLQMRGNFIWKIAGTNFERQKSIKIAINASMNVRALVPTLIRRYKQ